MKKTADISSCGSYRYVLTREWGEGPTTYVVIGLNPSTADADRDDPTIRRCIGFARDFRADRLVMLNLFAYRATSPKAMLSAVDPVGDQNDEVIARWTESASIVIAAWGVHGAHLGRDAEVRAFVPEMHCLGVTKAGHPRHPLYLPRTATPRPYMEHPA